MGESYVKLFSTITTSTIWEAPHATRIVWVTMLALTDRRGEIQASVPGLARIANVSLAECEAALDAFLAPDRCSRTEEHEGRRIEKIDGGWRLLNYRKYRERLDEDATRERKRIWDRENRPSGSARKSDNPPVRRQSDASPTSPTQAEAEAEAKEDTHHAPDVAHESGCVSDPPSAVQGKPPLSPEAEAAIALRKRGCNVNSANPNLLAALAAGVTVPALVAVAEAYPGKPAGYVIAAARRQHAERASPIPNSRAGPNGTPPLSKTGAAFHALDALATQLEANPHASDLHPAAQLVHRHDPARLEAPADLEPGSNARRRTAG